MNKKFNFLNISLLLYGSILLGFPASPAQAQTCSNNQIKADLLRSQQSINYFSLGVSLPVFSPLTFDNWANIGSVVELERNPLRDLPYRAYNTSFYLTDAAKNRIIDCGESGIVAIADMLEDKSGSQQLRIELAEILLEFPQYKSQSGAILRKIILDQNEDIDLRYTALDNYSEIADHNLNAFLLPFLKTETDFGQYAVSSFRANDPDLDTTVQNLVAMLFYQDRTANQMSPYYAAQVLGNIAHGYPEAIAALMEVVNTEASPALQIHAAAALGQLQPDDPFAKTFLINFVGDPQQSDGIRTDAAIALATVQSDPLELINLLTPFFEDPEFYGKRSIENALVMAMFNLEASNKISPSQTAKLISSLQTVIEQYRAPSELPSNYEKHYFTSQNISSLELTIALLKR
ncbi:MAG: HEAT repeat domain-containing protein [Limnothrix sp. RL_2_0]|nr:HEAT repeat domain-containing protein [Limnothrix sp. RL_2_0]